MLCSGSVGRRSRLHFSSPHRLGRSPALSDQFRPELDRFFAAQVFTPFQQGRRSIGHSPAVINEHLGLSGPSPLIAMKPANPKPVAIDQPTLLHKDLIQYRRSTQRTGGRSSCRRSLCAGGSQAALTIVRTTLRSNAP